MTAPSDPLERLRKAWALALNEDALSLLRRAASTGAFERKHALRITGRTDVSRNAAEDLADRLAELDLLERRPGKPVSFAPTTLGEAVLEFIDKHLGIRARAVGRPTVILLDREDRAFVDELGIELYTVLTRAAIDVVSLHKHESA